MRTLILVVSLLGLAARADSTTEIWKAKCKSCHGEDGAADTKVGRKEKLRDMRDPAWHADFSDEEIRKVVTDGSVDNKKMKAFKEKLSPEEIQGLVHYIRGFRSGVPIVQAPPAPPPTPPTTADQPVNTPPAAPKAESPPVEATVKVTDSPERAAEPSSSPNSWLSIAAIALSIVALIIALTRKR